MTQLSLGIRLPTDAQQRQEALMAALPDEDEAIVEEVRNLLPIHHDHVSDLKFAEAGQVKQRIESLAIKLNGRTMLGIGTKEGAYGRLKVALAAQDGEEPMHGQPGRFLLKAGGCRSVVYSDGVFGFGAFQVRAIDLDRPFLSSTGFRSFMNWLVEFNGGSFADRCRQEIEDKQRFDLVKIDPFYCVRNNKVPTKVGTDPDDPAWKPGGWLYKASTDLEEPAP